MTRSKKLRVLRDLYARIPEVHCKGLCDAACGMIPMGQLEKEQIEAAIGRPLTTSPMDNGNVMLGDLGDSCELLVMGRCTVYDQRPAICRVFGAAEGLPCRHGCVPDRVMRDVEAAQLFQAVTDL